MTTQTARVIREAMIGNPAAVRSLVDLLTPLIQARAARVLLGAGSGDGRRDLRQDVREVTRQVLVALFADQGRLLLAWDPARGLSLVDFVGLVAQRHARAFLRRQALSGADTSSSGDLLDHLFEPAPEPEKAPARPRALSVLLERLQAELTPRGLEFFQRLFVEAEAVADASASIGMSSEALSAWRRRLAGLVRQHAQL